jgi:CRISPR-associated protein Cas2
LWRTIEKGGAVSKQQEVPDGESSALPPPQREERQFVVVSYDIPNDRRRTKVCKLLKDYGMRVQYSVVECWLRPRDLQRLQDRLKPLLVTAEDDVRFYRLCENCKGKAVVWSPRKRESAERTRVV